ncbi:mitogen-activated protein kinase-binding protein 1 isoform X3 [Phyllopteryx taeniolatus]|uniref:mitogen-activated protein kinase-binding protein 1 isoform X3 n=1 Tax=Phyllopteryx taeniolatus TaxID=161469 RepID=UPI002AD405BB|nr:mitogen-activated protein kinase-binding protein 1 isoform X3 [Phyllopteryx taeniolatus]
MSGDDGGGGGGAISRRIKNLLRSPSIKLRGRGRDTRHQLSDKVTLEKVLGITAPGNRALSCDPRSGLLAYPAGCVVVLLHPRKNKQRHIFNASRKTITTLAFSSDGKHVVTGESGHVPAVRVWEVASGVQVAALQEHKYGVACVAFSPDMKYIVSVGYPHDMMVHVWNWKVRHSSSDLDKGLRYTKGAVVAANKVSSKVTAVSFSHDSSYFVTAGNRHVKFWYLDHSRTSKASAAVPLLGRSGLLGELKNNFFCDVACGQGQQASSTFCISTSGLLVQLDHRRMLHKWVELRRVDSAPASQATCLCVTDELIFCGCSDGAVRAFSPHTLHFLCTLPRPHFLGADVASMTDASRLFCVHPDARYPDTVALTYDPSGGWLTCVYSDHSVYVWDVGDLRDPRQMGKLYSALYHTSCVWSLEVFPEDAGDTGKMALPPGCFLSCSSDNTIRVWNVDARRFPNNILSHDLHKVIYVEDNPSSLLDADSVLLTANSDKVVPTTPETPPSDQSRAGVRSLRISPNGRHLASGDRVGILRVHDMHTMEEIINVQAHDGEILSLDFSQSDTGVQFLATASRDRLIHVLDAASDYHLVQTLDEHSSSITAVRFAANEGKLRLISCGADKSVYFRTGRQTGSGTVKFTRTHHVVRKCTLYDMDVEPTRKYAAIGCQDRSVRIFNINNSKQKKIYKGSQGEDGTLIKVQIDPSGLYIATSCSDKSINMFDFYSGECVAAMFGHSEVVTGLKFSSDCTRLISVSGDSCIFVWRLSPELTLRMRQRLAEQTRPGGGVVQSRRSLLRRTEKLDEARPPRVVAASSDSDGEEEDEEEEEAAEASRDRKRSAPDGRLPRRRWTRNSCGGGGDSGGDVAKVTSMLDLRQLDSYCWNGDAQTRPLDDSPIWIKEAGLHRANQQLGSRLSLQVEHTEALANPRPDFTLLSSQSLEKEEPVLFPDQWEDGVSLRSDFEVKGAGPASGQEDKPSPDSGCSLRFNSRTSSPDAAAAAKDTEPTVQTERLSDNDDDDSPDEDAGPVPQTPDQEAFLKKHFATLADIAEGPSRTAHSSNESLSMSSRFLSQNSAASRVILESEDIETKSHPVVSEVQNPMTWTLDQDQQTRSCQPENEEQNLEASPGMKESDLRRVMEAAGGVTPHRPTSLPSAPRRTPVAAAPPQNLGLAAPGYPQQAIVSMTLPRKCPSPSAGGPRSYMSPTASSAAKMSRSASLGDGLNRAGLTAGAASGPGRPPTVAVPSFTSPGCQGNRAAPLPHLLLPDKPSVTTIRTAAPLEPPPGPQPQDDADPPASVESCQALTDQMLSCFKRATRLYRKVRTSCTEDTPEQGQMACVLSEALEAMRAELQCLPLGAGGCGGGALAGAADQEKTAALLEEYSMLLLQAVHRKLGAPYPS